MAADTAAKRLSAVNLGNPVVRGFGVYPVGSSTAGTRAAGLYLYSGIGGGDPPAESSSLSTAIRIRRFVRPRISTGV